MKPDEKSKIKIEIENRIKETIHSIERLKEQSKPVSPDRAIGRITRMDAIGQKSMAESNLRSAEQALVNLEEALLKLEEADFGLCIRCGKGIPLQRILIVPESKCCVACA